MHVSRALGHMGRRIHVVASAGALVADNASRCAESHLLDAARAEAARRGVAAHALARWLHRKWGDVHVERRRADGTYTCSLPCITCRRALARSGIQWRARDWDGIELRSGDDDCPAAVFTSGQKALLISRPPH